MLEGAYFIDDRSTFRALADMLDSVARAMGRFTREQPAFVSTSPTRSQPSPATHMAKQIGATLAGVHAPIRMYCDRLYSIGHKP